MADIIGSFRVNKIRWTGADIQYAILFLKDRMVFAKVGGQFADFNIGGTVGGVVGGAVGAGVGSLIEKKLRKSPSDKRDEKIKSFSEMPADEIIKLDKNNFEIFYKDTSKIEIKNPFKGVMGLGNWSLSIEGKRKEKFVIAPKQKVEECQKIVKKVLSDKF